MRLRATNREINLGYTNTNSTCKNLPILMIDFTLLALEGRAIADFYLSIYILDDKFEC